MKLLVPLFVLSNSVSYSRGNPGRKFPWPNACQVRLVDAMKCAFKNGMLMSSIALERSDVFDQHLIGGPNLCSLANEQACLHVAQAGGALFAVRPHGARVPPDRVPRGELVQL